MAKKTEVTEITMEPRPKWAHHNKGQAAITRKHARNLALAARESIPAYVMMDFLLAIMEGHGQAVLKRDARHEGGWYVLKPEGGLASTPEQKQWAWLQWRLAGYGQPIQTHVLDAELRSSTNRDSQIDARRVSALSYEARRRIMEALQLAPPEPELDAARQGSSDEDDVEDAEIVSETIEAPGGES